MKGFSTELRNSGLLGQPGEERGGGGGGGGGGGVELQWCTPYLVAEPACL